jgi:branched-chain amino acid transport system substrate-binding protein
MAEKIHKYVITPIFMKISLSLFCIFLVISGCAQQPDQESLKLGGAFALTGDGADWGNDEMRGAQLAVREANEQGGINGRQLELIVEDTHSANKETLDAVQKLVAVDKVVAIIGPTWGDSFGAVVAPYGEENKIVQITPSGAIEVAEQDRDYPHYFSTWYPLAPEAQAHIDYMKQKKLSSVVIIHDEDPYNTLMSVYYAKLATEQGIAVKDTLMIAGGDTDFRTVLLKAKSHNPDVIFVQIFQVNEVGSLIKQSRELGLESVVMATASAQTNNLLDSYSSYAENLVYSYPASTAGYAAFESKFIKQYGRKPSGPTAGTAYDATNAVIAALKQNPQNIRQGMQAVNFSGVVAETVSFNERGQLGNAPFIMKTVRAGAFVDAE